METNQSKILDKIKSIVQAVEPTAQVMLYGSRSRGTSTSDSDWDILILVDKPTITPKEEQAITYPLYDLEFDIGEIINPVVYTQSDWNTKYKITPFYRNVMQEAVSL